VNKLLLLLLLDRRPVSDVFYWHEMEQYICDRGIYWIFQGTIEQMKKIGLWNTPMDLEGRKTTAIL